MGSTQELEEGSSALLKSLHSPTGSYWTEYKYTRAQRVSWKWLVAE